MKPIYIRTDRNGTKIFHDYTCPRCGGAGEAEKWRYTGLVCFECGGTGKRAVPQIVKEYTPEYWAKLQAKQKAKAEKLAAEQAKFAADHAEEIGEARRRTLESRYAQFGCGKDGVGYVLKGNTFKAKDQIKEAGGRWIYGVWVCPVEIKGDGIMAHRINLAGHIGGGSMMWLDDFDLYEAIQG